MSTTTRHLVPADPAWKSLSISAAGYLCGLVLALVLGGCHDQERAQVVADSAATIHAAATATEQGAPVTATAPIIKANALAIVHAEGHVYPAGEVTTAVEADRPLAVPAATPAEWRGDLTAAALAGQRQAGKAESEAIVAAGWNWSPVLVGLSALAGMAGVIGRFFPGVPLLPDLLTGAANLAWKVATPRTVREAEDRQAALAKGFQAAVDALHALPDPQARNDLLTKVMRALPPEALADLQQALQPRLTPDQATNQLLGAHRGPPGI